MGIVRCDYVEKFPGHFLIESPKVDFMTNLDTYGAIPRSDSMDLVDSVEKFPGILLTDSKSAGVNLSSLKFQDLVP